VHESERVGLIAGESSPGGALPGYKRVQLAGRKPFGYYHGEGEIIVRMKALRATGLGFDRIAARLNDDDVPSRDHKFWNGIVVNRILAREAVSAGDLRTRLRLAA